MALQTLIFASLIGVALSAPNATGPALTVTGVNLNLPEEAFGGNIEGAAVDHNGNMFAADFRFDGSAASLSYAAFQFANGQGILTKYNPLLALPNDTVSPSLIAGSRFLTDRSLLLADASKKRVLRASNLHSGETDISTFCANASMLQPNDLALSTKRDSLIFLSGQNYTANTAAGVSGDLWTCDGAVSIQFPPSILKDADIHRTNGIETSPCGKYLYLSSAVNVNDSVVSNKIFRFALNATSGMLLPQAPRLFYDFKQDGTEAVDIDGMRTDVCGNLFISRNGNGTVVKLSPEGQRLLTIVLPGMGGPSNLDFGGKNGKTLFAIGRCPMVNGTASTVGCAASWENDQPGKAWARLQKKAMHL